MTGVASVLFPLALMLGGLGQDVPPLALPTAPDPVATTIALTEISDRMTVPVQIAGAGPYRFVIDTGSERTVISRELAGKLGLATGRFVNVTAMSGTSRVGTVVIPSLSLSSVPGIGAIQAPALEASHLGGLGLLGIDTLKSHKVVIDFDADEMTVTPSVFRTRSQPRHGDEIVVHAKSMFGQLIVTDAEFMGRPIRVVIDTGSPITVGNEALRKMVSRAVGKLEPLTLTSATGGAVKTRYARVDKIRVGGVEFQQLPIAFADAPPFARFGLSKRPAMLLGMSALKSFRRVDIDFANREVRFRMPRGGRLAYNCSVVAGRSCAA
jgi:predicted aspartyl protease